MTREIFLYCTNRKRHDPVEVHTISLPDGVEPGEYVKWTPVFHGGRLDLSCKECGRPFQLGNRRGSKVLGQLERESRTIGRVPFDLSYYDS